MNKKIFKYMSIIILLTVLVFSILWGGVFAKQYRAQTENTLKNVRVSIIDTDGTVIFDNFADIDKMENHGKRPEVEQALKTGAGDDKRLSGTLREDSYYYAVRLNDGRVLRLAMTSKSLAMFLHNFLPLFLLCLAISVIIAFIAAKKLTNRIVAPINSMDVEDPDVNGYDELLPFVRKMKNQQTEIKNRIAEIQERSETIETIATNMREGLIITNVAGEILTFNRSAENILGSGDMTGRKMIEVYRDINFIEKVHSCLEGKEERFAIKAGNDYYEVLLNPVKKDGEVQGALIFLIGMTENRYAQMQRQEFSANVSHELKTPLTVIAATSEMMANGTVKGEDLRFFADRINVQSRRLIGLIEDIIELSEFDEKKADRNFTRFNLYDLADTVVRTLSDKAKEKGVSVGLRGNTEVEVTAGEMMIDELIYNLIDNGIKYNSEGGSVRVGIGEDGDDAIVTVSDDGIGIPQESIPHIFERFYRVDKSRSKKTGGTGLGLSIVKHIAEHHEGSISVESKEGEGTTFRCRFPKNGGKHARENA